MPAGEGAMVTSIDSTLLLSYYNSKLGSGAGAGAAGPINTNAAGQRVAPTAPWSKLPTQKETSAAVASALAGHKLVDEHAAKLDLPGASTDYKKLFALYNGLETLGDLAAAVQQKNLNPIDKQRLQETFDSGLKEVQGYMDQATFDKLRVTSGTVATTAKTTTPVAATPTEYVTAPLYAGTSSDDVPAFQGNVAFTITVKRSGVTHTIDVNLADMGTTTRSMANVVSFINDKLTAEGIDTRFRTVRTPGVEQTIKAGGQTIKTGVIGPDQWSLKVVPAGETVSFSAAATAPAVYMSQAVGDPNPDGNLTTNDGVIQQQFLKFQTDTSTVDAPIQGPNQTNWVDGREFAETLGSEVKTVHATKVAADGSVYVLADVTKKTGGQDIAGSQDVALLKYDSAGKLQFTQTLGASDTATGLGLAISDDGSKVAVVGSVVGQLNGATDGALNSGPTGTYADQTDSFVTVYNASGEEQWTERRGARQDDQASQVAFGSDGTVYVSGSSKSALPGAASAGSYIEAFSPPDASGKIAVPFTQQFGTGVGDKPAGLVVDGTNVVTASVENGHGVLRRFDVSSGTPVLTATRDLGDLQAGDITGLALDNGKIIVAGSTTNGALAGGTVTSGYSGGVDAFAASFNADLSADPADAIAYYGGSGDDHATALTVSGGKVFIAGSAGTDLPGQPPVGKKDGFLAQLDIGTGTVAWSRRFTGKDGFAAPTSIAVDLSGASALDRLGLPKGVIDPAPSAFLTASSSLRAGEQFSIKVGSGAAQTVTIDNNDTLDTLAQKIRRATGFQADVSTGLSSDGFRSLTVKPNNSRTILEFSAGSADKDALSLLGIPEGIVDVTTVNKAGKVAPADGKGQIYGLGLPADLNLNSTDGATHAANLIAQAQTVIRNAYKDLVATLNPKTAAQQAAAKTATGKVPAYLTAQIANYQAALDRLTGGQQ
jgi:hypothetical protein